MSPASLHIALVHYPALDRQGKTVATSAVNYDLHDLARSAATYGVASYTVITPLRSQVILIERLVEHWTRGHGASYNPSRKKALETLRIQPSIEATLEEVAAQHGQQRPFVLATSARRLGNVVGYASVRRSLSESDRQHLLLFGTGWGLTPEAMSHADALLAPVQGVGDYNHLSVRSAVAIVLDRLLGRPGDEEMTETERPEGTLASR